MNTACIKTPLKDKVSILKDSAIIIGMAYVAITFFVQKGIIQYQNAMISITPLIPYHLHFKLAIAVISAAFFLFFAWIAHNFLAGKSAYNSFVVLFTLFAFSSVSGWAGTLYMLSTPLTFMELIAILLTVTAFAIFFTYITIRAIWLTIFNV